MAWLAIKKKKLLLFQLRQLHHSRFSVQKFRTILDLYQTPNPIFQEILLFPLKKYGENQTISHHIFCYHSDSNHQNLLTWTV